jgi:hypothetical protein
VLAWFTHLLLPRCVVWVAQGDRLLGFSARKGDWLEQIYLLRQGLGTALLTVAKAESPTGLNVYTVKRDVSARAFYESHGFELVLEGDGTTNEEGEPDVRYRWEGR